MTRRTLLVLAASRYQLEAIMTARRLGWRVITADNVPQNPGHRLSDKSYNVDTRDHEAILRIARDERVDGVIAACTDVAVPTAARVARELSLSGPSPSSADICTDKLRFREYLRSNGFPTPEFQVCTSDKTVDPDIFAERRIIKPDQSSGSKGIFIVNSLAEFRQRLPESLAFSPNGRAILERFIDGWQGTCEGIVRDGKVAVSFVLDRETAPAPYVATVSHRVPSVLPAPVQVRLIRTLEDLWTRLEYRDGPFDCDFVAADREMYLLEMSPRIGGNSIPALLRFAAGFDLVDYSVQLACGEAPPLEAPAIVTPTAICILGVATGGRLSYSTGELERLKRESWVRKLDLDVGFGAQVHPFINGRHRLGEAVVTAADRHDLDERVHELRRRLDLRAS